MLGPKNDEERLAEILSINTRKAPPKFYVHYVNYNKRLDEWITTDRINLDKEVLYPKLKATDEDNKKQKRRRQQILVKRHKTLCKMV